MYTVNMNTTGCSPSTGTLCPIIYIVSRTNLTLPVTMITAVPILMGYARVWDWGDHVVEFKLPPDPDELRTRVMMER